MLAASFFERDPVTCARELIGATLVHEECAGVVIETEAYAEHGDEACHLFTRPSARAFADRNPPGTAYSYLNYGIHWLINVLTRDPQTGDVGLILIRALDPTEGIPLMKRRRNRTKLKELCSGPGKLSQAMKFGKSDHERWFCESPEFCFRQDQSSQYEIQSDRRIGISAAKELPWRFLAKDHPGVSVPFGKSH